MILEFTDMAPTGEAIGRHAGMVILVPFALPGERAEVEIVHQRKNYARGRLVRILRESPERVTPRCKYFGICGGCEWQHASDTAQLAYKTRAVGEQLRRIGRFAAAPVQPCIASPASYAYRNHTQFVLSSRGRPGYYSARSKTVVEVDDCPILHPSLNELMTPGEAGVTTLDRPIQQARAAGRLADLRELHARAGVNTGERMIVLERNDGSIDVLCGETRLRERVDGHSYAVSPTSFFQVNTPAAELLAREVLRACALRGSERVLELYCGVGFFTLPISERAGFVRGVESSASAVADAALNLAARPNVQIVTGDAGAVIARQDTNEPPWDIVVVDPPRAGVEHAALLSVIELVPRRIVYVSCDAATLARDARLICDRGYTLAHVQPLDLFPQTHHVEIVATFVRQ